MFTGRMIRQALLVLPGRRQLCDRRPSSVTLIGRVAWTNAAIGRQVEPSTRSCRGIGTFVGGLVARRLCSLLHAADLWPSRPRSGFLVLSPRRQNPGNDHIDLLPLGGRAPSPHLAVDAAGEGLSPVVLVWMVACLYLLTRRRRLIFHATYRWVVNRGGAQCPDLAGPGYPRPVTPRDGAFGGGCGDLQHLPCPVGGASDDGLLAAADRAPRTLVASWPVIGLAIGRRCGSRGGRRDCCIDATSWPGGGRIPLCSTLSLPPPPPAGSGRFGPRPHPAAGIPRPRAPRGLASRWRESCA